MKAIAGVLVVLLAALSGLAQESAPKAKTKDKTPDYYPTKVGTKWEYQVDAGNGQKVTVVNQIAKIEKVDGKPLAVLETLVNGQVQATEHIGVEAGGIFRYRFKGIEVSPPVCLLKYPVKEGASWETETKIGGQEFTVSGRVGGTEEVKVPSGKYQAVSAKIETTVKGNKITNTYWFAPDVGIIKQSVGIPGQSINMELSKFEEGK
jgi:hypothetical protein